MKNILFLLSFTGILIGCGKSDVNGNVGRYGQEETGTNSNTSVNSPANHAVTPASSNLKSPDNGDVTKSISEALPTRGNASEAHKQGNATPDTKRNNPQLKQTTPEPATGDDANPDAVNPKL
jgi:hypothetical protein